MKPYYQDDAVTLYQGDCREVTEWLAADVLVTDPPYGIDWQISSASRERQGRRAQTPIANDKDLAARDDILAAWGARPAIVFGATLKEHPASAKQILVWEKTLDSGVFGTVAGFRRNWEAIYLCGPWPAQPANRSSVIRSTASTTRNARDQGHAHSKPVGLMEVLIASTDQSAVIADPFAGSGSTLVAAKALGRKAIGVELEERYCELIAGRLSQGVLDFGEVS